MSSEHARRFPVLSVSLPDWVERLLPPADHVFETLEERMQLAIELARINVQHQTGGPFGAAIFDRDSGRLVAPGVNVVVPARWSGGHAEMVAFAMAQQVLESHDLGSQGLPSCELVTSCEPCSMCYGATPWTGITRLVCGAREADAEEIGFDEGPKPDDWVETLTTRGIEVERDILRSDAAKVLRDYGSLGGDIYNGRFGTGQ